MATGEEDAMMEPRTYNGRCHCGAVRFRFKSEEITKGKKCNCSICVRKGGVMSVKYYPPDEFELLEGREHLSVYHFGDKMVNHHFCRICGVYPFHDAIEKPGHYRVNLGCVDGVDPLALEIEFIDGRAF